MKEFFNKRFTKLLSFFLKFNYKCPSYYVYLLVALALNLRLRPPCYNSLSTVKESALSSGVLGVSSIVSVEKIRAKQCSENVILRRLLGFRHVGKVLTSLLFLSFRCNNIFTCRGNGWEHDSSDRFDWLDHFGWLWLSRHSLGFFGRLMLHRLAI